MPFQAIPIAFRSNTGDPLAKLLYIYLVAETQATTTAPNGKGLFTGGIPEISRFCQCSREELLDAVNRLERLGLIGIWHVAEDDYDLWIDINFPMSDRKIGDRKRLKASPDQVDRLSSLQSYICPMCGEADHDEDAWHVDHIIPRSRGGADTEENCQVICAQCNSRKGARMGWVDFLR